MSIQLSTRVMHIKDQSTGSYDTIDVIKGRDAIVDNEFSDISENPVQNKVITKTLKDKADIIISSASGTVASFPDGAEYDAVGLTAEFAPYQEGTGDPSPENVRPIHGWTGLNVYGTSGNIVPLNAGASAQRLNIDGTTKKFVTSVFYFYYFPVPKGQLYFSTSAGTVAERFSLAALCDEPPAVGVQTYESASMAYRPAYTFNNEDGHKYLAFGTNTVSTLADFIAFVKTNEVCVSTVGGTSYTDPVDGTTTPITWQTEAGEVYGGYVDAVKGKLVAEWEFVSDTWGNAKTTTVSEVTGLQEAKMTAQNTIQVAHYQSDYGNTVISNILSKILWNGAGSTPEHFYTGNTNNIGGVRLFLNKDTPDDTVIQFALKLATPIEYDITPATIELLLGYNNVWTNAGGNVDVDYRADTKLYLGSHMPEIPVEDVQVNGTSVVNQGVASIGTADTSAYGVVRYATDSDVKSESSQRVITPYRQHQSTFYGLAKAAADITQSASSNPVGTYTDAAKIAIRSMLDVPRFTPKVYVKSVLSADDVSTGSINLDGGNDIPLNIYEELVIVAYQSDRDTHNSEWGAGQFGYVTLRDVVNNGNVQAFFTPNSYINEKAPLLIRYKRLPNCLIAEMHTGEKYNIGYNLRATDHVDYIRWFSLNGNNATLYAGCTVEAYII